MATIAEGLSCEILSNQKMLEKAYRTAANPTPREWMAFGSALKLGDIHFVTLRVPQPDYVFPAGEEFASKGWFAAVRA